MRVLGRYVLLVFGLLLMGFGIALITKARLGTSPISTVPLVGSYITPISFGAFTFVLSLLFMVVQLILQKKLFNVTLFGQIIVGIFFGLFVDFGMFVFSFVNATSIITQLTVQVLGCLILSIGIYLQVVANVAMNAGEALVKLISNKYRKEFSTVKVIFDWSLVVFSCVLSFLFLHKIKGIGIGTIISAFLVGYMIKIIIIMKEAVKRKIARSKDGSMEPSELDFVKQEKV